MRRAILFAFSWLAVACPPFSAHGQNTPNQQTPASEPLRVLFIGNSLTYTNDLPAILAKLGMSADSPRRLQTKDFTRPQATLEQLWRMGAAAEMIRDRRWDFVVLQERGTWPIRDPGSMYTYARLFDAEIRKSGAKTIFFVTWASWEKPETQDVISRAYYAIAKELNAIVAPVGPAWEVARELEAKINLHNGDRWNHPTVAGSYLAACVIYLVIVNHQPCPAIEPRFDIQQDEIDVARNAASRAVPGVR